MQNNAPRFIIRRPFPTEIVQRPEMQLPPADKDTVRQIVFERTRGWKRERGIGCFI